MDHHGSEICVAPLTMRLLSDPALYGLCQRMPDDRIRPLLHEVMATETDRLMRGGVHATLRHHDLVYRAECDAKAQG